MSKRIIPLLILLAIFAGGCKLHKVSFSMSGVTINPLVKSFSVDYFANKTPFEPDFGPDFTEALRKYLRSRTSLIEDNENNGDIRFEGQVTEFSQRPMEITREEEAAKNRLTIKIRVKYTNTVDEEDSFEQEFSHYKDYDNTVDYDSVKESLMKDIREVMIEDIFNKALVNW